MAANYTKSIYTACASNDIYTNVLIRSIKLSTSCLKVRRHKSLQVSTANSMNRFDVGLSEKSKF
jgi:hypothetical protein